jgi:hypothetical protein
MATALLTRYGYPKVPGDQPESIIDVSGPASYTPLVEGSPGPPITPITGGQRITAADFGLQSLDFVVGMGSTFGSYFVVVFPELTTPPPSTQLPDGSFRSALLAWMDIAGGQASGDLSQFTVRLFARGR